MVVVVVVVVAVAVVALVVATAAVSASVATSRATATARREADAAVDAERAGAATDQVHAQLHAEVRAELHRLGQVVGALSETSAQRFGQVDRSLQSHAEVTRALADSARTLREALASPTARGQWGERMADDVLRLAGFIENVNYVKQTQLEGATGRPDFTFPLPKGHELHMDVKFPMAEYLRFLDATTDHDRRTHRAAFLRDVRARVRELARRDYANAGSRPSVDYVLLFLPNEQLTGFIHEHDPELLDHALQQRVVMCSPLTLFAFLGVIRQAFDNYMVEQTSDEILALIGTFGQQWTKYNEALDKVKTRFEQLDRSFEELSGPRRRQLEKPLRRLEAVRVERGVALDRELLDRELLEEDEPRTQPRDSVS